MAIERAVRPRFSFSIESFTDVVLERISARAVERDPAGYLSRLCLDDLYLAVACSRGDDDAWRECRERYFDYIRGFTKRFLHDRAAADVAAKMIAELWQRGRFAQYDGRSTLRTWLGAVAAHAAINAGKCERRTTPFEPDVTEHVPPGARATAAENPTEDQETHRVFAGLVSSALARLDAEGKLLLLLYYEQRLMLEFDLATALGEGPMKQRGGGCV